MIMEITTNKNKKNYLRQMLKQRAASLPKEYCKAADEKIFRQVTGLAEYRGAERIFCYVGTENEINTLPILEHVLDSGKRICVPKCLSKGIMEAYEIKSLHELAPGAFGILEPDGKTEPVDPAEIDLALIPCLSCSCDGRRLGYGGGYYDRYLQRGEVKKLALCREEMLWDDIPIEEHDMLMDGVVTEDGVLYICP